MKDPIEIGDYSWIEDDTCEKCGAYLMSQDCWVVGCDDGWIDMYEYDDPLWYDPGDVEMCDECQGRGILTWCSECGWTPDGDGTDG